MKLLSTLRKRNPFANVIVFFASALVMWAGYAMAAPRQGQGRISFTLVKIANKARSDGTDVEIRTILSSNGDLIYKTTMAVNTTQEARKELDDLSREATKIVRRTPELDKENKVIGERILAEFYPRSEDCTASCLFYSHGPDFSKIESDSLAAITSFDEYSLGKAK